MKINTKNLSVKLLISIISVIIAIYIGNKLPVKNGLEFLYLLPLSLAVFSLLFGDVFLLYRKNVALFIIFFIIILRYLVTPFLISYTNHTVSTLNPSPEGFKFAILMMIIELLVVLASIKYFWKKDNNKTIKKENKDYTFKLSSFGAILIILTSMLLFLRGNMSNVFDSLTFFMNFSEQKEPVFTYDLLLFMVLKTIVFLSVASWAKTKYSKSKSMFKYVYILIALLFAGLNFLFYDADQRTMLAQLGIGTASVLVVLFPKQKKHFIVLILILVIIMLTVNFTTGTLFYDQDIDLKWTSEVFELYTANVSTMAHSYDIYGYVRNGMTEFTFLSDLVRYFGLITFPGLRNIFYYFLNISSTPELFQSTLLADKAYIMTTAGFSIYHGTLAFGWIINILTYIFMIKFIYEINLKQKATKHIGFVYMYSFIQILASLILINNLLLFYKGVTGYILLVYIFIKINDIGIRKVKNENINFR